MWCASLSSWSMLSLAARWRWNCLLFGEPEERALSCTSCVTAGRSEVTKAFHQLSRSLRGFCALSLIPRCDRRPESRASRERMYGGDWRGAFTQGLKLIWNDQTLRHWAICLVCVCVCVYIRLLAGKWHLTVGCWSPLLYCCLFTRRGFAKNT